MISKRQQEKASEEGASVGSCFFFGEQPAVHQSQRGKRRGGIIETFLVFSVASFIFPVVARSMRANPLAADIQKTQGFLKLGQVIGLSGAETVSKLKTIISLNTFQLDPFSLEFVDYSEQNWYEE